MRVGSTSGGVNEFGRYMAVMPLAWFSGLEANCFSPRSVTAFLIFCDTSLCAANRSSRGLDRMLVKEV